MFEENDSVFNTKSVPSNISYKSFELPMQNYYSNHRIFDSVKQGIKLQGNAKMGRK